MSTPRNTKPPRRRWMIGALLGVGILINYLDRISLSVAAPQLRAEFHLSPAEVGLFLSAFFWSYSLLQVPAGMLLDRLGPKPIGRWGALLWSAASLLTAVAGGFGGIFAARVLLGVAEAPAFPACAKATTTQATSGTPITLENLAAASNKAVASARSRRGNQ